MGPLLFLLFVNDIPKVTGASKFSLFAGDAKWHKKIIMTVRIVYMIMENVVFYVQVFLHITINNIPPVRRVQCMTDLGISVTSDLLCNSQMNALISKCNRMMGMITRSVGYKAPVNVTSSLCSTLARNNLEHSFTVSSQFNFIEALVYIQRAATRHIY